MSLLQYFKRKNCALPDPDGGFAAVVPPQIIISANNQVRTTQDKESKRGPYQIIADATEQAKIGKYASFHGVAATLRHFKGLGLKDSTVQYWKNFMKKNTGKSAELWLKQVKMKQYQKLQNCPEER